MADENKTERVQLLMTPSEVKAIDDWSFENRIRGRAEAMRRLCQLGIYLDTVSKDLTKFMLDNMVEKDVAPPGFALKFVDSLNVLQIAMIINHDEVAEESTSKYALDLFNRVKDDPLFRAKFYEASKNLKAELKKPAEKVGDVEKT